MTPRTIDSEFAERLALQQEDRYPLDLSIEGPIMHQMHPRLIWAKLQHSRNPDILPEKIQIDGWNYACFDSIEEASLKFPEIELKFVGRPWSFKRFSDENHSQAIIDFPPLGTLLLSRNDISSEIRNNLSSHLLPIWLTYAISPELWGPQGKWIKFHQRIIDLFENKGLSNGENFLGYYQLSEKAKKLESFGFIGTQLDKSYILVLPWTFSLSALNRLEKILREEF